MENDEGQGARLRDSDEEAKREIVWGLESGEGAAKQNLPG